MTVMPSFLLISSRYFITEWLVAGSRLATGSSASISSGFCISARAIPTRCCWPPESASARLYARCRRCRRVRGSRTPLRRRDAVEPPERAVRHVERYPSRPASTLLKTELRRTRLNCWKIIPMRRAHVAELRRGRRRSRRCRRTRSWPDVGSTKRLMQRSSVDLPEPDRPMRTRNSPRCDVERDAVERARAARIGLHEVLDRDRAPASAAVYGKNERPPVSSGGLR